MGHDQFASFQQECALEFTRLILDRFLEENPSLKGEFTHILKDAKCCKSCKTKTFGPSHPSAYMNLHIKENEGFNNVMERLLGAAELDDFACSTCQEKNKTKTRKTIATQYVSIQKLPNFLLISLTDSTFDKVTKQEITKKTPNQFITELNLATQKYIVKCESNEEDKKLITFHYKCICFIAHLFHSSQKTKLTKNKQQDVSTTAGHYVTAHYSLEEKVWFLHDDSQMKRWSAKKFSKSIRPFAKFVLLVKHDMIDYWKLKNRLAREKYLHHLYETPLASLPQHSRVLPAELMKICEFICSNINEDQFEYKDKGKDIPLQDVLEDGLFPCLHALCQKSNKQIGGSRHSKSSSSIFHLQIAKHHNASKSELLKDGVMKSCFDILSHIFQDMDDEIIKSLGNSTTVCIYLEEITEKRVVSLCNFSLIPDGIFINWLCASHKKLLTEHVGRSNAGVTEKRGFATFLLSMMWQICLVGSKKLGCKKRLMVQANSRHPHVVQFYYKRGFCSHGRSIMLKKDANYLNPINSPGRSIMLTKDPNYFNPIKHTSLLFRHIIRYPSKGCYVNWIDGEISDEEHLLMTCPSDPIPTCHDHKEKLLGVVGSLKECFHDGHDLHHKPMREYKPRQYSKFFHDYINNVKIVKLKDEELGFVNISSGVFPLAGHLVSDSCETDSTALLEAMHSLERDTVLDVFNIPGGQIHPGCDISSNHLHSIGFTFGDILSCRPRQWLNDRVICGVTNYIYRSSYIANAKDNKVMIFDLLATEHVFTNDEANYPSKDSKIDYVSMLSRMGRKKNAKGVKRDLFDCDSLLFPVREVSHWYGIIAINMLSKSSNQKMLLVFDSMHHLWTNTKLANVLRRFKKFLVSARSLLKPGESVEQHN